MAIETTIWTYEDAVERLLDSFEYTKTGRQHRLAREAVLTCYRELATRHPWKYYQRRHIFQTSAEYTTGTVAYDHTGGSNEREVTLSSGTWPTDAAYGVLQVGDDNWPIATRESSTVLTLDINRNPGADIAAGTSYTWYREAYPLPVLARRIGELVDPEDYRVLQYVNAEFSLTLQRSYSGQTTDRPHWYTIRNDDRFINSLSIVLGPPPNTSRTYEMIEETEGRPLVTEVYSTGSASVTVDTASVSISGASLSGAKHLGGILRLTTSTTVLPTSQRGGISADNPFDYQRVILSVDTSTTLTVDQNVPETLSGVKFTISSPLDIEQGAMTTLFWRMCDREFAELINAETREIAKRKVAEKEALGWAMDADRRSTQRQTASSPPWQAAATFLIGDVSPLG